MRKITGDIFGCYYFNCFHSYITQVTCQKGKAPLHIHTHNFNLYPFLYVYGILGLPWAMKGAYGNAAAPPTYPHWEARVIIILTILCQEFGSWFCTVVKVLGLSICPWTADYPQWEKFAVGQIQHVLGGAVLPSPSSPSAVFRVNCHHPQLE